MEFLREPAAIICFQERNGEKMDIYAVVYQQRANNHVCHTLATFFRKVLLVNAMEIGPEAEYKDNRIVCHGYGEMVARFVKKMKEDKRGDVYLSPAIPNERWSYFCYVTNTVKGVSVQIMDKKMPLEEFVNVYKKDDDSDNELVPPTTISLAGNILTWTRSMIDDHSVSCYKVTARAEPGILPVRVTVDSTQTQLDLSTVTFNVSTQYRIVVTAVHSAHGEGPPSNEVIYRRNRHLHEIAYTPIITGIGSLIFFEAEYSTGVVVHAVVRQQWGGGLDGVGYTLATFLSRVVIDYSIVIKEDRGNDEIKCGGFNDMIARYITKIREDKAGHPFYLLPNVAGHEEEYNYHVKNTIKGIVVRFNDSQHMSIQQFLKTCKASRNTVSSLRTQSTSVIMSALLQRRALKADNLYTRLPQYVPTVVKKSIVEAVFGRAAPLSSSDDSPPPAKKIAIELTSS